MMMKKLWPILLLFAASFAGAQNVLPAPWVEQPFLCNNGLACSNGFLYTYASGTSTPLSVYVDYTGAGQNTNPVQLNAGGFPTCSGVPCGIWLAPGTSYRFILQNSAHVQQYVVDGVIGRATAMIAASTTPITANQPVTTAQNLDNAQFGALALNVLNKTFEVDAGGSTAGFVNNTEQVQFRFGVGGQSNLLRFIAPSTDAGQWTMHIVCQTSATGTSGSINCAGLVSWSDDITPFTVTSGVGSFTLTSIDLTVPEVGLLSVAFGTASSTNSLTQNVWEVKTTN
jgi:hypothetical protein